LGFCCSGNPMSAADSPSTKGRGGGWGCPVRGYGEYFYRALGSNAATAIIGVARRLNTLGAGGFPDMATSFWDGATLQCWVGTDTTGHLVAYRGAGTGTVLATSTLTLTAGSYVFLEVLATVHNTTGSLQIRVNGADVEGVSPAARDVAHDLVPVDGRSHLEIRRAADA